MAQVNDWQQLFFHRKVTRREIQFSKIDRASRSARRAVTLSPFSNMGAVEIPEVLRMCLRVGKIEAQIFWHARSGGLRNSNSGPRETMRLARRPKIDDVSAGITETGGPD
jgi:hypothetical protein